MEPNTGDPISLTLTNIKDYIRDRSASDGSSQFDRIMEDIANDAHRDLHGSGKYDFDKRYSDLTFSAQYTTGTVSINSGSTALTGSGTTFTSGMVNRLIRLNGENKLYVINTFSSTTSLAIDTYLGDTNLSGVTYEIIDVRKALPARFRDFAWPITDDTGIPRLRPNALEQIWSWHRTEREVSDPVYYAVQEVEASSIPEPHMWIYPAPSSQEIITIPHYVWPADKTSDSDIFEIPFDAEDVFKRFVDARIAQQRGQGDWPLLKSQAETSARRLLGNSRNVNENSVSEAWTPEGGGGLSGIPESAWGLAPGEPVYT